MFSPVRYDIVGWLMGSRALVRLGQRLAARGWGVSLDGDVSRTSHSSTRMYRGRPGRSDESEGSDV
jgi:hypothetical protein